MPDDDQPAGRGEPPERTRRDEPPGGPPTGPPTQAGSPQSWFDDTGEGIDHTQPYGPPSDPTPGVVPGIVLDNRYRLEELLGRGATAEVYRGLDELLGRQVAVKVFHRGLSDPTTVARQRTEMQVLAKLQHPNLVTVYDAKLGVEPPPGATDTSPDADLTYLVMELVQGGTLANRITPTGMAPSDVARIGAAVAGALAAVHAHGLVHRDVKPANILMSTEGDVKLSDFGIARELAAERLTAAVDVIGTAAYLSPEQARGAEVGPPTDVYALGLVLLESLTGRREFPGQAVESAVARLLRDPAVPDTLPGSWPALLRSMTGTDPARRPSAAQVEATLTGRGQLPAASPATATLPQRAPLPPPAPKKSNAGRTFAITLLIVAIAALGVVGVVALIQRNSETNTPPVTTPPPTSASSSAPSQVTVTETRTTARTTPTTPTTPTTTSTSTTPTTTPTTPTTTATTPTTPTTQTTPTTPTTAAEQPTAATGSGAP